jgi:hypothetical protein
MTLLLVMTPHIIRRCRIIVSHRISRISHIHGIRPQIRVVCITVINKKPCINYTFQSHSNTQCDQSATIGDTPKYPHKQGIFCDKPRNERNQSNGKTNAFRPHHKIHVMIHLFRRYFSCFQKGFRYTIRFFDFFKGIKPPIPKKGGYGMGQNEQYGIIRCNQKDGRNNRSLKRLFSVCFHMQSLPQIDYSINSIYYSQLINKVLK